MCILKVAHIGFWYELLLPYVRDCFSSGSPMSVNDFLYVWVTQVGWNNPNYKYIFNTTWLYLMGIQLLHIGVRRNNAEYIRVGHMTFAPLFHRNCASKYALSDLHDRYSKHTVSCIVWSIHICLITIISILIYTYVYFDSLSTILHFYMCSTQTQFKNCLEAICS